jgi:hypothetical protein
LLFQMHLMSINEKWFSWKKPTTHCHLGRWNWLKNAPTR